MKKWDLFLWLTEEEDNLLQFLSVEILLKPEL